MTAQIVVMNKEAVALASDSAVTLSIEADEFEAKQKIFTSANKLFALSKYQPVGIMIYGNAQFMDVPFETIVKTYRNTLGRKSFNTLEEYANDFLSFLDNGNSLFPESLQLDYVLITLFQYFYYVKSHFLSSIESEIKTNGKIGLRKIRHIVAETISNHYSRWKDLRNIPSIPDSFNNEFSKSFDSVIDNTIKEVFENVPLSKLDITRLRKLSSWLFSRYPDHLERALNTGIVIAGFGYQETFPSLRAFEMELICQNKLKYRESHSANINFSTIGSIIPFAQGEMVHTFMEGIAPNCKELESSAIEQSFLEYADAISNLLEKYTPQEREILNTKIKSIGKNALESLIENLENYRQEHFVQPITTVVAALPKDEIAAMAESFVHLTSIQKRYTMEAETVGGAIDVAVISKGDGFIWIKRKHYFQHDLNPGFTQRYYEDKDEQE